MLPQIFIGLIKQWLKINTKISFLLLVVKLSAKAKTGTLINSINAEKTTIGTIIK